MVQNDILPGDDTGTAPRTTEHSAKRIKGRVFT